MPEDDVTLQPLPFDAAPQAYDAQAVRVLAGHRAREAEALATIHRCHPRFRSETVAWLPRQLGANEVGDTALDLDDARLVVARLHDFADWAALCAWVEAVAGGGAVTRFEASVEAVVTGDVAALERLLRAHPELAHARSSRRTPFDPPVHRATLLHYVAANGVEGQRQRVPPNAVTVARTLLDAGAEVDALADFYGCACATLTLLVSSSHPVEAGLEVELTELLLDRGAALEGHGERWGTPLMTALAFGQLRSAEVLARGGARIEHVAAAAGLGRADDVARLLDAASASGSSGASSASDDLGASSPSGAHDRHLALALAAQLGHVDVVRLLLDAGENPDRFNPQGAHAHTTPLHQAVWGGHASVVELLVQRGARLDVRDTIYDGTPLDWARHAKRPEIEAYLRAHDAG